VTGSRKPESEAIRYPIGGGRFHVFVDEQDREPFLAWLPRLSDLPLERVLIAHGEPVLSDGAARVREAVAEARALHA